MVPLDDNPIDAVWPDRPAPSLGPIVAHDEAFTGRSSADKRTSVAAAMATDRIDAAVLSAPDSIAWLLNVRGADVPFSPMPLSFAILADDASLDWFVDSRKLTAELDRHLGTDVRIHAPDLLSPALDRLGEVPASLLLGAIWSLWHLPIMAILPEWRGGLSFGFYLPAYTVTVIGLSLLMTRVWLLARRSTLAAVWMHGVINALGAIAFSAQLWDGGWSAKVNLLHFTLAIWLAALVLHLMRRIYQFR